MQRMTFSSARSIALLTLAALASMPVATSAQTLARIRDSGKINIGFTPDQAPFSSAGRSGSPEGYAVELCKHVASTLDEGAGAVAVNYVPTDAAAGLRLVQEGKIDLLCGPITETVQARESVSFSVPIYFTGIGAVIRRDAPEALMRGLSGQRPHAGPTWRATVNQGLANYVYAVRAGSESEARVQERAKTAGLIVKLLRVATDQEGIDLVASGKAHAFFADRTMLMTALAQRKDASDLLVFHRYFTIAPVGIALARDDEEFRLAVDRSLSEHYRTGGYLRTFVPYFGEPSQTAQMLLEAFALR